METDRNLLFGVLALQAGLINSNQFVEACTLWTTRKNVPLADLLVERQWIASMDVFHLQHLLQRRLEKYGGDARVSLAAESEIVTRLLAGLDDNEVQQSLAGLPRTQDSNLTTDFISEQRQRYKLSRLHATGGIGRVWVAYDADLGREIALKELRPEIVECGAVSRRFLREARITGQLEHPGIVPVYELAKQPDNERPFYTMRFVKGRTLTEAARTYHQNRTAGEAESHALVEMLNAFVTVCNTVAFAHSRGVIHRDLKGQNVILGDFGEVVVLDWGLAKVLDQPEGDVHPPAVLLDPDQSVDPGVTLQGETIGTPAYMAPEQAAGRLDLIDFHTDVYGLGAMLYEILTGQAPFSALNTRDVLRKVQEEEPIPPRLAWAEVPPLLEAACLRAMAKKTVDRYASAMKLAEEVQNWQEAQRRQAEEERDRFFGLSHDMFCAAGFDGMFKRLNPAFQRVLGYTKEELLAQPYLSFVHPDDREATIASAKLVAKGEELIFFENRYLCKDGSYKWLQWTARPIVEQQVIYASARDTTERKQGEAALRESEARYRSAITAMKDGIVLMDSDGRIRTCNVSAERILGLSAGQMEGRTALDPRWHAIHEDGSVFPGEAFPSMVTLHTGKPCSDVLMGVQKPNGELRWISINSEPVFEIDGITLTGVVVSFSDITAHKRTEEALKRTTAELERAHQQLQNRL